MKRRSFVKKSSLTALSPLVLGSPARHLFRPNTVSTVLQNKLFFKISLAQWSYHKALFSGKLKHLDFAEKAKSLDIDGIEYVNAFFKTKAEDFRYLGEMNKRASDAGVQQLLIMIDGEGGLGDLDKEKRKKAVENHYKWVNAAKFLGCHSIRVNAHGEGPETEVAKAATDGLYQLSSFAAKEDINIIVENHGSYSSKGNWLAEVIKNVQLENCGTLPDFGNFCVVRDPKNPYSAPCLEAYDKYKGVAEMMPYAKAVSAKTNDFDENGDEKNIDYLRMMTLVKDHNYTGYVGIEYEGRTLDEESGIIATRDLLIKVGKQLSK